VPVEARAVFVPAAVAVFAAFAVFGLLTAIAPGFLATLLHLSSPALAGAVVFSMFTGSALGQVGLSQLSERVALPVGCAILLAGLGLIAAAVAGSSPGSVGDGSPGSPHGLLLRLLAGLLVAGAVVVGVGQGVSFRAGMAAITAASPAERRAGTVASFFVTAYLAISVPVILVGVAATVWGLRTAALWFTGAAATLAAAALVAVLRLAQRGPRTGDGSDRSVTARPGTAVVSRR
jgi:MFS family permease